MGWAERAAQKAGEAAAGVSTSPREGVAGAAPSEWLEGMARRFEAEAIAQANALTEVLHPKTSIVGPGGQPKGANINPMAAMLECQVRTLRMVAVMNDLLLTFLTGRPELRPMVPGPGPGPNGGGPVEHGKA